MASRRATPVECGTFDSRIGVPDQEPALWHIELFGRLRATSAERTITRFPAGKARELLARLACYPDREHSREELVELLWPEVEPGAGRLRLRVAINSLRKQLEPPGVAPGTSIVSEGDSIRLDLRAITSDVYQFHGLLRSAQRAAEHDRCAALLAQAVELSECELLPGSYEDWILQERELLAEKRQSALLQLIRLEEEAGNLTGALEYARKSVLAAPEREERHQDLIRLLVLAGRREEAKRQLRKLARTLREQLGGTPRMETRRLLDLQPLPARPPAPPLQVVHAPASQLHARSSLEGAPRLCRLPLTLTRFVGRETELEDLQSLIAGAHSSGCEAVRLVIVTGPGGVGKTRLAIETARRLAAGSGAEALFVGLSDIQDAERMPEAILQALGVPPLPGRKALGQAIGALSQAPEAAEGPLLLLLDNLEHLLQAEAASAAVRSTIGSILRELPRVIVLATSRQITGVSGEREYPLQPLPAPAQSATALRLLDFPSVRLFVDRAQAVRPDFQLTPKNAAAIGAVCERLEGLPLAIELASAWARVLTPQQTLERLDRRFDLLVNRHKSVPERARSLEAAIRWSYDLLSTEQQKLVCRLSVFRGGWTIEAVAAVWADSVSSDVESRTVGLLAARPPLAVGLQGSRPKQDRLSSTILEHTGSGDLVADRQGAVIVALTELAERSIIRMEETETGSRYRMLESVREFMQERMSAAELERAQELHAQWCLNANPQCAPMRAWLDAVEAERHNIAAAIRWCAQGGRGANPASASDRLLLGMRIASKTSRFWVARGYLQEAYGLYSALLSCADQVAPGADAARALLLGAGAALVVGDRETAHLWNDASLEMARQLGDRSAEAKALHGAARLAKREGDASNAEALCLESAQMELEQGDYYGAASNYTLLGSIANERGEGSLALEYYRRAQELYTESEWEDVVANLLANMGNAQMCNGEYGQAEELILKASRMYGALGHPEGQARTASNLGNLYLEQGEHSRAVSLYRQALALECKTGNRDGECWVRSNLAWALLEAGSEQEARAELDVVLNMARATGDSRAESTALNKLGCMLERQGDLRGAWTAQTAALTMRRAAGYSTGIVYSLWDIASLAHASGEIERATLLAGAAEALRDRIKMPLPAYESQVYNTLIQQMKEALGVEEYRRRRAEGERLSRDDAIELALNLPAKHE